MLLAYILYNPNPRDIKRPTGSTVLVLNLKDHERSVGYRRFNRALGAMMSTMGRVLTFLL